MNDLEGFIDSVIAHLRRDLPGRILAINAEKNDDIELEIPATTSFSTGGDPILTYPWVEVAAPDFAMEFFSVGQVDADMAIDVVVRGWVLEPRTPIERADRHVKRMGRALYESLTQPDAFGDGETISRIRGAYRINPEFDESEGPMAACTFVFTIGAVYVRP